MEMHIDSKKHGTHIIYFDIEDWDKIKDYKWHIKKSYNTFYAGAAKRLQSNMHIQIIMHRVITECDSFKMVDHINGNGLDNRKDNLRTCTNAENSKNQLVRKNNTSGYKGVHWHKHRGKYNARIYVDGTRKSLGYFDSKELAAKAYNNAAIKHYGGFAKLNILSD